MRGARLAGGSKSARMGVPSARASRSSVWSVRLTRPASMRCSSRTVLPTTLESGEFSVVKNFDFVSLFFVDIVEDFLGQYNVTTDTLTLLGAALNTGAQLLLLRTVAKIGAPVTSFSLTGLDVSPT